jgi:hypothetical protein
VSRNQETERLWTAGASEASGEFERQQRAHAVPEQREGDVEVGLEPLVRRVGELRQVGVRALFEPTLTSRRLDGANFRDGRDLAPPRHI